MQFESTDLSLRASPATGFAVLAPIVSVPIAPAVVTKSATDSVDSNCFYFRSVLYLFKFSVNSVNSV